MTSRTTRNSIPKPTSRALDIKPFAEIMNPSPKVLTVYGHDVPIYPMPNSALSRVGEALQDIASLFISVGEAERIRENGLGTNDILQMLPGIIHILVPYSNVLIAAALRCPEEWVADNLNLGKRMEALTLILEAEDVPLLVECFMRAVAAFRTPQAAEETEEEAPTATETIS